jgi:hypothetical protein
MFPKVTECKNPMTSCFSGGRVRSNNLMETKKVVYLGLTAPGVAKKLQPEFESEFSAEYDKVAEKEDGLRVDGRLVTAEAIMVLIQLEVEPHRTEICGCGNPRIADSSPYVFYCSDKEGTAKGTMTEKKRKVKKSMTEEDIRKGVYVCKLKCFGHLVHRVVNVSNTRAGPAKTEQNTANDPPPNALRQMRTTEDSGNGMTLEHESDDAMAEYATSRTPSTTQTGLPETEPNAAKRKRTGEDSGTGEAVTSDGSIEKYARRMDPFGDIDKTVRFLRADLKKWYGTVSKWAEDTHRYRELTDEGKKNSDSISKDYATLKDYFIQLAEKTRQDRKAVTDCCISYWHCLEWFLKIHRAYTIICDGQPFFSSQDTEFIKNHAVTGSPTLDARIPHLANEIHELTQKNGNFMGYNLMFLLKPITINVSFLFGKSVCATFETQPLFVFGKSCWRIGLQNVDQYKI